MPRFNPGGDWRRQPSFTPQSLDAIFEAYAKAKAAKQAEAQGLLQNMSMGLPAPSAITPQNIQAAQSANFVEQNPQITTDQLMIRDFMNRQQQMRDLQMQKAQAELGPQTYFNPLDPSQQYQVPYGAKALPMPVTYFDPRQPGQPGVQMPPGSRPLPEAKPEYPIPPGFKMGVGGTLVPVPGGPAAMEIEEAKKKEASAAENRKAQAQNVISTVDSALQKVGFLTAGPAGQLLSNVGGTSAADLEADVETIKANLGFDRLTQMRNESKTGGALGQVSNIELDLLTSAVNSLKQKQSPDQLRKNLLKVKKHYSRWAQAQSGEMPEQTNTPQGIKQMFKAGEITREQAKSMLRMLGGQNAR